MDITLPTDPMATPYAARLNHLAETVYTHAALCNRFYAIWRSERLHRADFERFAVNYFARVYATTTRLSIALSSIQDWESRIELLHNLSDELGHGVKENVHVLVLFRWLYSLHRALGGVEDFRDILEQSRPLATTRRFIDETNEICRAGPREAAGILLAQEWNGYTQIAYLLDGFAQYRSLYEPRHFHDVCEYFYVHLGRAEKEHQVQASCIAARHCHSEEDFAVIASSFNTYLDRLSDFWNGIAANFSGEYACVATDADSGANRIRR